MPLDPITIIGNCPPDVQPNSMTLQRCFDTIKDIKRIVIQDPDGVDPFNDDGTGPWPLPGSPLANQAALLASFEDQTKWDAAIAEATVSKITLTPAIHDAQRPKSMIEPVELPDTTSILPGTLPDVSATYTSYGISSTNHYDLINMSGQTKKFLLIDAAGNVIYKDLTDAEISNGDTPWFEAKLFNVSTRDVLTGGGNVDNIDIMIKSPFGNMVRYAVANTSSFGLII